MGRHWLPGDLEHLLAERAPEGLFVAGSDRACEKWIADQAIPEAEDLQLHHFCRAMASLGEELDAANHGGMYGVAFFMTCATTVLSMLVDAFGTARHMPPQSEDQSPRQTFATLFEKTLSERLPAEDWAYFGAAANKRLQALDAARQGRLDVSRSMFVELWEEHSHAELTLEAHMLVDIFLSAGAAYLHFRLGEFAQAQGLLHRASILDHRLATDFDLPLMSAHRLQLAQNLIRVHARQNHQREAVEFAILFLDYLEFRNDVMPITLASPRALLDSVPASVGAHYFDRICSEIALLMAGRTDFDVASLFAPLSHHAWSSDCAESHFGRMAHAWLRCKAWLVRDKPDEFLSTAIGIIRRGRGTEPLLWFATIFDAIAVCRGLGGEAAMTAKWLAREAAELPDLPPPIREAAAKVR